MGKYKEDTNQNVGTVFFIILFALFVSGTANISEKHNSFSRQFPAPDEQVFGENSNHSSAVIFKAFQIPDLQIFCSSDLHIAGLNSFSVQNRISDYNRRSSQNLIMIQKKRFSTGPDLQWRLPRYIPTNEDDPLPVLS
jgi:hypothetical protein